MRNFKTIISILCLFMFFGCQTNDSLVDETPEITGVRSLPGNNQGSNTPIKRPAQTIAVQYPPGFDKLQFSIDHGAAFGLIAVQGCVSDVNRDIWAVEDMTEAEMLVVIQSIFIHVPHPNSNSNGDGGVEGYARHPFSHPNELPIIFYYNGLCY